MIQMIILGFSLGIAGYFCMESMQEQRADEEMLGEFMQEIREERDQSKID